MRRSEPVGRRDTDVHRDTGALRERFGRHPRHFHSAAYFSTHAASCPACGRDSSTRAAVGFQLAAVVGCSGVSPCPPPDLGEREELRRYLKREPDPQDHRSKGVRLTRRGDAAERTMRQIVSKIETELEHELGPAPSGSVTCAPS